MIALALGALIANLVPLPARLNEAFRVEFYIKTGIVLLGATLPITLIIWAGPIAIVQASIVSIVTFLVIYWTALFLELDRKLAALLAVGGAVCGVSAVIAIAGAIRARREHISDRDRLGRRLVDRHDLRAAAAGARLVSAGGRRRRLDRNLGVRRRRRLRRGADLWRVRPRRRGRRHAGSGDLVLHAAQGRRTRHLDRHLGCASCRSSP